MDFFWPGPPAAQPVGVGDLRLAKSALFVAVNGFISPSYFSHCPCDDGRCFQDGGVEQRFFHLANFVTAMLGLALVLGEMAFSAALFRSQAFVTVAQWLISVAKVATVGTFQHWVNVSYLCLK
ncbi:hypothetical protein E2562_009368 [Oryza meyeriana var. granulata]|uniref:Uncharacterized protein n=1 Tax=Oryza meyeriana var. granulata TaxID=110450 RepID=A0A6G1CGM9_9ORYZ|nr:hypothetical protein E2562_009368 [Oryza meyeriana var. granulata]